MKKILAIAWNDIRIEFSEWMTLVFFLLLPLVFTVIIGQGLQGLNGNGSSNTDTRIALLVTDESQGSLSQEFIRTLGDTDILRPVIRPSAEAEKSFQDGQAPAWLVIPSNFDAALGAGQPVSVTLHTQPGDDRNLAVDRAVRSRLQQVNNAVQAALSAVAVAEKIKPFQDPVQRQAYFASSLDLAQQQLSSPAAVAETTQSPQVNVQVPTGFEQSSPGQLVTWTLITLLGASEVFVNERLGGTLRRLLVTPTSKTTILLGKLGGRLALGLIQMTILIGFGTVALGVNWGHSWSALVLIAVAFAVASVALGVLLGAFARTRSQASGLTIMFSMLLGALGGAWWPLEVTPPVYQMAVKSLPTTWAMIGFNDVIVRGQGVSGVLPEAAVLLGFAAVFFILGIRGLKFE